MAPPKSNVNPVGSGPFFHAKGHEVEKDHGLALGGDSWKCKKCKQSYDPDEVHVEADAPEDDYMSAATAAKKVGSLLEGHEEPIEPSVVVPVNAPAGLANLGERMVGQVKESDRERRRWTDGVMHKEFIHRNGAALANVVFEGEHFKFHPGAWPQIQGNSLYVANKLIGDSRISRDTPLSHLDLYSAYKSTPHAPASVFLKYLIHRANFADDYDDPQHGHKLDKEFIGSVQRGKAGDKNAHVSIQDLHDWTTRHATTVVPQLLAERQRTQMDAARGIGLNVRSINGEPHVALTRGLNTDIMEKEHPLSSHADKPDTGFGTHMHHSWVPLKDLWFAYDLDRTKRSGGSMGPEDEYLVSNTGTRYEAAPHDVKTSRIKSWTEHAPYVYDDMSDETLAKLLTDTAHDGVASHDVYSGIQYNKNAGPKVYEAQRALWAKHGWSVEKPAPSSFGYKWYPREDVMKAAAPLPTITGSKWFTNPNLTSQDLEVLAPKLFANDTWAAGAFEAGDELLQHPAMNSHLLEKLWRTQHGNRWMVPLLKSPLASHQMREDAIEVAKFNPFNGDDRTPLRLMEAVVESPHHTPEQGQKIYDWAVGQGLFNPAAHRNTQGALQQLVGHANLPQDLVQRIFERKEELDKKASDRFFGPDTISLGEVEAVVAEKVEHGALGELVSQFENNNKFIAPHVAAVAAQRPGRLNPARMMSRLQWQDSLEPELQSALINELRHHPEPSSLDYLVKLASSKKLSPESIAYLANYPDEPVRDVLFRNKSVTPEQIREAFPKSVQFPEQPNIHFDLNSHMGPIAESIGQAYWRRKEYEAQKSLKHFIKPLPQDLAKSSNEDMWRAQARSWLADQTTKGFYTVVPADIADNVIRDRGIEPQFTEELLEGEAVFARPATPVNLERLQTEAGPDEVVLYFETEAEPQQHTDGSLYWTSRVPCETVQMADVGDAPLAKMHTPLTFPKLGVGDDRRETKLVSTPGERKTYFRAAAAQGIRENYTSGETLFMLQNRKLKSFRADTIDKDAKSLARTNALGNCHEGIAGKGHPGYGVPKEERASIPGAGTGQSHMSASFAPTDSPRRKLSPESAEMRKDPRNLPATAHHEDLHRIFARVQHKHGEAERMMLARNLIHVLPQDLQSAVMKHLFYAQPKHQTSSDPEEEAITELTSYLNQTQMRDGFHEKQQHSPEQQKAFHDKMKRAYRLLLAVSPTVDEGWLHHEKPWLHSGKAMRKFTEPQSGTGLSAAEAHEVLKGSTKLAKSHPDLVADPNAFAFKFETDPAFMEAIDSRNWELQLRKSRGPNYPKAAMNFMKEFNQRTVDNGFDPRLGRYHNTTGDNTEGTLIVMDPRIAEWHGPGAPPVVSLDWIKALKPGNGDGHRSMKFLTDLADKHGISMELHVGNDGSGGFRTSPKPMLHKFYKKHGFVKRGKFEKDILVRKALSHPVVEQGDTLKLGSKTRTIKKSSKYGLAVLRDLHARAQENAEPYSGSIFDDESGPAGYWAARAKPSAAWHRPEDADLNPPDEWHQAFRSAPITINFPAKAINGMLKEGRLKNQEEVASAGHQRAADEWEDAEAGLDDDDGGAEGFHDTMFGEMFKPYLARRREWESKVFGIDPSQSAAVRPIYGALHYRHQDPKAGPYGSAPDFGEMWLTMKPDVKARSTFVSGDSFGNVPERIFTADQIHHVASMHYGEHLRQAEPYKAIGGEKVAGKPPYVETQVHGGVQLGKDVEAINVSPSVKGSDRVARGKAIAMGKRFHVPVFHHHEGGQVEQLHAPTITRRTEMEDPAKPRGWSDNIDLWKAEDEFEPLAKMAVIHDDPTKPMTVYRIQNKLGEGPYQALDDDTLEHLDALSSGWRLSGQPIPVKDFSRRDLSLLRQQYSKFAFEKPEHATAWFGHEGMGVLSSKGFKLSPVKARLVARSKSGKQVFFQPFAKSEEHVTITLPHEKVLGPGEESAAKAFLGHNKVHETALAAARFLVGRKEEVDEDMFRLALNVFDGDHERAALVAVGLTDSEPNLKALRAALKLGEFSQEESSLSKNEPGTPHIESVNPGAPDAAETADEVRRGVTAGLVQPLKLGGKHSKGSMAVRDPKAGNVWLLKPGSGKQSPAAGARDDSSSQSSREAAFWHCADRVGLGNYYPKSDLLEVNGAQVAAMKLLGTQWKSLDERNRAVDGYSREVLAPYLERGDIHRLAALDWILGNPDSHGQNVMVHAEAVALIDHGSAFAGPNFAPGKDSKSFTPYYLRVFAPSGYSKKKPEDRVRGLPVLTPAGDSGFKKWVQGIEPALLAETMGSHGIGQVAQEAVLARLSDLQHHGGPSLSEYLNGLWAGL